MHYVVALNGSVKVSDKAMTPDDIERTSTPVDRLYYLERVRKAMDNIFVPIYEQLAVRQEVPKDKREGFVKDMLAQRLWRNLNKPLQTSAERKRKCLENSPLMQAFAKRAKQ